MPSWEEQCRTGQDLIICLKFSITRRAARAIWKIRNKEEEVFWQRKCELIANFSGTVITISEGRDGKCEERNEKCEFLARESVNSSPFVRTFGKGKCKLIANFSATIVTSLPSVSVSLSLSLSHRKYLTHNIGSASALPIILGSLPATPGEPKLSSALSLVMFCLFLLLVVSEDHVED